MVQVHRLATPRSRTKPHLVLNGTKILCGVIVLICVILFIETSTSTTSRPDAAARSSLLQLRTKSASAGNDVSQKKGLATVAFAVSITGCGTDPITEGAAVLMHSIHRASVHGSLSGKYDYDLFAIYHPQAAECAKPLQKIGWNLLERDVFVKVSDIKGDYLREKIESNGCCGEKELIKLEAYTLTDYPIVVHLDLDVLVLKPMDDVFDMMLATESVDAAQYSDILMPYPPQTMPARINAFFTYDYNMVSPLTVHKPVQGGLIILRPDLHVYEEFRQIVLEGDFRSSHGSNGSGWGGKVGPFHGSMTFQGIVPYYYNVLHEGKESLVLNRCVYNQMCDNPRDRPTKNDIVSGTCRTGEAECEDCRSRPLEDVVTTHFTLCQKPWWCLPHTQDAIQHRLCQKLTREWYRVRSEMEQSWGRSGQGAGNYMQDIFFGYCQHSGHQGYTPIGEPYGAVSSKL
ncbi:hypothetical protein MPSEU_000539400 [Mayamaea pseudoterrestris]|nr:hypothetical protein MPSEU_000539400 [Mayamaea pseudoterrestris]